MASYQNPSIREGSFRPHCRALQLYYWERIFQAGLDRRVVLFAFPNGQTLVNWIHTGDTDAHELLCFKQETAEESDLLPVDDPRMILALDELAVDKDSILIGVITGGLLREKLLYAAYVVPRAISAPEVKILYWDYGKYLYPQCVHKNPTITTPSCAHESNARATPPLQIL
jgi:hypothetical protein